MNESRKPRSPTNKNLDPTAAQPAQKPAPAPAKQVEAPISAESKQADSWNEAATQTEVTSQPKREPRKEIAEEDKRDPRESSATREEQLSLAERRETRVRIGRQQRLEGIARPYMSPKLYLRFVLDKPGRLETHLRAAYEFVLDSNGKHVKFPSGTTHLHLMKLPIEFRNEDLKDRETEISAKLVAQITVGKEEYTPDGEAAALTAVGEFDPDQVG